MGPEEIDWRSGRVVLWDLAFLDPFRPLGEQVNGLKEDLAQVCYSGTVVLDVGWYPEFSTDGAFVVSVVREGNWDEPIFEERHRTCEGLLACLNRAVLAASKLSEASS